MWNSTVSGELRYFGSPCVDDAAAEGDDAAARIADREHDAVAEAVVVALAVAHLAALALDDQPGIHEQLAARLSCAPKRRSTSFQESRRVADREALERSRA